MSDSESDCESAVDSVEESDLDFSEDSKSSEEYVEDDVVDAKYYL